MSSPVSIKSSNQCHFVSNYFKNMTSTGKLLFAIGTILAVGSLLTLSLYCANSASYLSLPVTLPATESVLIASGVTLSVAVLFNLILGTGILPRSSRSFYLMFFGTCCIWVNKSYIREAPEYHLNQFTRKLKTALRYTSASLRVKFLRENGASMPGMDAGGPSKDYLDDLFSSLVLSSRLSFERINSSSLAVPRAEPRDRGVLKHYRRLGQAMMICHNRYIIGQHFDPSLFKIAFSLSADEINHSFESLSADNKLSLYRALLEAQENSNFDSLIQLLLVEEWTADQIGEARVLAEALQDDETPLQDHELRPYLTQLASDYLDPQLRAIHAVAQGMKSICIKEERASKTRLDREWDDDYRRRDHTTFSTELQGITVDRTSVANYISYGWGNAIIQQKVQWLKEWIREEATVEEIRQFLKFATGSTSLHIGTQILVHLQNHPYLPVPRAHTCSPSIDLAPEYVGDPDGLNDHTKEGFIACIKFVACGDDVGAGYAFL